MGNVSYRFFTCLFNLFLAWIVLINFLGWSGGAVNLTGVSGNGDWTNSYFGFQSLFGAVKHYNYCINLIPFFALKNLPQHLDWMIDDLTFGIPDVANALANGKTGDGLAFLVMFAEFCLQPLTLTVHSTIVLAHLIVIVFSLVQTLMMCITGAFNIPFETMPNPSDYQPVITGQYLVYGIRLLLV